MVLIKKKQLCIVTIYKVAKYLIIIDLSILNNSKNQNFKINHIPNNIPLFVVDDDVLIFFYY